LASALPISLIDDDDVLDIASSVNTVPDVPFPPLSINSHATPASPVLPTPFTVTAPYLPTGDQPLAIQQLCQQLLEGDRFSILRGITGTGKTFVMSHLIAALQKPTLVLCHNKTLAAQLCRELRSFLSHNAVELFVSYYNHYVPESFVETTGTYIAKKSSINDEIDALRHRATRALLERNDVVVVASVSCIYGLGLPKDYLEASVYWQAQDTLFESLDDVIHQVQQSMLYQRPDNEHELNRCQYQLSTIGSDSNAAILSLWPPNEKHPLTIRLEQVEGGHMDTTTGYMITSIQPGNASPIPSIRIFPAKHHVVPEERLEEACLDIEQELQEQVQYLKQSNKLVEATRLQQRVTNDLLLLRETGFCSGVENYSRHFAGRQAGETPDTLMDYLGMQGRDWLLMIDESHVAVPQLKAMYVFVCVCV
jgi:excinuclease ABC subunit B